MFLSRSWTHEEEEDPFLPISPQALAIAPSNRQPKKDSKTSKNPETSFKVLFFSIIQKKKGGSFTVLNDWKELKRTPFFCGNRILYAVS